MARAGIGRCCPPGAGLSVPLAGTRPRASTTASWSRTDRDRQASERGETYLLVLLPRGRTARSPRDLLVLLPPGRTGRSPRWSHSCKFVRPSTPEQLRPRGAGMSLSTHLPATSGIDRAEARELGSRGNAGLPEHVGEVVLHSAEADEQLHGDFVVRGARGGEVGDPGFARGQVESRFRGTCPCPLAGRAQFGACLPGEAVGAHRREHGPCGAKLAARVPPAPGSPEPLPELQVCARQVGRGPAPP